MAAQPARILIVDDDPIIRRFVGSLLVHNGYEVHEAEDGEAGLHAASAVRPALILLDLVMPYRDGFEVINALKEDPATGSIPILIVSVKDREEDVVKALNLGADDYMIKPFSTQELLARIRKILERSS
ncbi:MAG TPA: response regulator [Candidatus Polarisedimenticolia bacterium]|nr:response regulator [Candidatus Polarisedimenticolia bacterium]